MANAISRNYKAFIYSGELKKEHLMDWFIRTVSNEDYITKSINNLENVYYDVVHTGDELIRKCTDQKLYIYGDKSERNLSNVIEHMAMVKGVKLFILDNLMTIDLSKDNNKYENQANMAKRLKHLAKQYNLVIILVAHPNKESEKENGHSMYGVLGASEIVNLCDFQFKILREIDKNTN